MNISAKFDCNGPSGFEEEDWYAKRIDSKQVRKLSFWALVYFGSLYLVRYMYDGNSAPQVLHSDDGDLIIKKSSLESLTLPHFCACPKPGPGFMSCFFVS